MDEVAAKAVLPEYIAHLEEKKNSDATEYDVAIEG